MRDKDRKLKEAESRYVSVKHCFECLVCKETTTFQHLCPHVEEWLETTAQCPHCREPMEMTDCTVIPFMEDWFSDSADDFEEPTAKKQRKSMSLEKEKSWQNKATIPSERRARRECTGRGFLKGPFSIGRDTKALKRYAIMNGCRPTGEEYVQRARQCYQRYQSAAPVACCTSSLLD